MTMRHRNAARGDTRLYVSRTDKLVAGSWVRLSMDNKVSNSLIMDLNSGLIPADAATANKNNLVQLNTRVVAVSGTAACLLT